MFPKSRSLTEKPKGRGLFSLFKGSPNGKESAPVEPLEPVTPKGTPATPRGRSGGQGDASGRKSSSGTIAGRGGRRDPGAANAEPVAEPEEFGMKLPTRMHRKGGSVSEPIAIDDIGWKLPSAKTVKSAQKGFSEPVKMGAAAQGGAGGGAEAAPQSAALLLRSPAAGRRRGSAYSAAPEERKLTEEETRELQAWLRKTSSESAAERREAAREIRQYTKSSAAEANVASVEGGLEALLGLLREEEEQQTVELAVTGLLNLSLVPALKPKMSAGGALALLPGVLGRGTVRARANAAACIFSIAQSDDDMAQLNQHGAVEHLLQLVRDNPELPPAQEEGDAELEGSTVAEREEGAAAGARQQGGKGNSPRRDAMLALLKLAGSAGVCRALSKQGGVSLMVQLLAEGAEECEDEAMGVLASMARSGTGCQAILAEGGLHACVDALEGGSELSKEFAVAALFSLCANKGKSLDAVASADVLHLLNLLEENGTKKAQKKAQQVIKLLEEHAKPKGPMLLNLRDELMSVTVSKDQVVIL